MPRFRLVAPIALTLAALVAPAAHAQTGASDSLVTSAVVTRATGAAGTSAAASPVVYATPVAATRGASSEATPEAAFRVARTREVGHAVAMQGGGRRDGKMYMIIGGAAFLAGAIIGDDAGTIIMIAGAGVGIYGLYLYLQ